VFVTACQEKSEYDSADLQLIDAVKKGFLEEAETALQKGAHVNVVLNDEDPYPNDVNLLSIAVRRGDTKMAEMLIDHKIELEVVSSYGMTPLSIATWLNEFEMVKLLVDKGANVNVTRADLKAEEPLMWAVLHGNVEMVDFLVEKGANLNTGADQLAMLAVRSGDIEILKFLFDSGLKETNITNKILVWAVEKNAPDIVELAIEIGADPQKRITVQRLYEDKTMSVIPVEYAAEIQARLMTIDHVMFGDKG
jgi:ankyrin repeat protein